MCFSFVSFFRGSKSQKTTSDEELNVGPAIRLITLRPQPTKVNVPHAVDTRFNHSVFASRALQWQYNHVNGLPQPAMTEAEETQRHRDLALARLEGRVPEVCVPAEAQKWIIVYRDPEEEPILDMQ